MRQAAIVEQLREKIRALEAQPRQLVLSLRTGEEALDALGAFRLGGGVELTGEEASGRTTLALALVAAACRERRLAAWVDGPQELYPPAAEALGVELPRLLIARPKAPGQLVWTAVQLLRSGAFTCVVLDVQHTGVQLSLTDARKLLDAARAGGALLVLLTAQAAPAQGLPRLVMKTRGVEVPPPGLRVVPSAPELPPEVTPTFLLDTPHGLRLVVPRARLARGSPLRGRLHARPCAPPVPVAVRPAESLQRPKKNVARDGYPMGWGRPGRDAPLHLPRLATRRG
jgi:hypothetical protein